MAGWDKALRRYQVDVPPGASGEWIVERREVPEPDLITKLRAARDGHNRWTPAGRYTGLLRRGEIIMSDAPDEIRDHLPPMERATEGARCLVNGLGLGLVMNGMLLNGAAHVTAVEISEDVLKLVADHWRARWGSRVEIVHGNAYEWKPPKGAVYDVVWHDIWPTICSDNLPEMGRLHRRYARRAKWQGSWARVECLRQKRRGW